DVMVIAHARLETAMVIVEIMVPGSGDRSQTVVSPLPKSVINIIRLSQRFPSSISHLGPFSAIG
ncbi:hypothetical protein A2U01_0075438, partial [Trifolium medium]|nr:hypothetical protein [Trifolium medium]